MWLRYQPKWCEVNFDIVNITIRLNPTCSSHDTAVMWLVIPFRLYTVKCFVYFEYHQIEKDGWGAHSQYNAKYLDKEWHGDYLHIVVIHTNTDKK